MFDFWYIMRAMVKRMIIGVLALSVLGCGGIDGLQTTQVVLTATPTTVPNGTATTLSWTSINATNVVSSNFGATTTSGTKSITPGGTITYTITVQSSLGDTSTSSVTVTVN